VLPEMKDIIFVEQPSTEDVLWVHNFHKMMENRKKVSSKEKKAKTYVEETKKTWTLHSWLLSGWNCRAAFRFHISLLDPTEICNG